MKRFLILSLALFAAACARETSNVLQGYGEADYQYESGHSGTTFQVGFAPRAKPRTKEPMVTPAGSGELNVTVVVVPLTISAATFAKIIFVKVMCQLPL